MTNKDGEKEAKYWLDALHVKRNGADRIIDLGVYPF